MNITHFRLYKYHTSTWEEYTSEPFGEVFKKGREIAAAADEILFRDDLELETVAIHTADGETFENTARVVSVKYCRYYDSGCVASV